MYQVYSYYGTQEGYRPVTDYVDAATAVRRLRLRRACRGHRYLYTIRRKYSDINLDVADFPFAFCAS